MNRRELLLALGAVACAGTPSRAGLVSLAPAITETLGALGALDRLVGRSDWCLAPPEAASLPALGSALTPELERIAALAPERILVDGSLGARLDELRAVGPVEVLPWLTAREVAASVARLGELVQRDAGALSSRFAELDAPPPVDAPSALLVLGGDGYDGGERWFVKRNSLHGAALHAAGARNAVDRDVEGPPALSLEALLALDPERIVVLWPRPLSESDRESVLASWRALAPLSAPRYGRVGIVDGMATMSVGPGLLELVPRLRAALATMT